MLEPSGEHFQNNRAYGLFEFQNSDHGLILNNWWNSQLFDTYFILYWSEDILE